MRNKQSQVTSVATVWFWAFENWTKVQFKVQKIIELLNQTGLEFRFSKKPKPDQRSGPTLSKFVPNWTAATLQVTVVAVLSMPPTKIEVFAKKEGGKSKCFKYIPELHLRSLSRSSRCHARVKGARQQFCQQNWSAAANDPTRNNSVSILKTSTFKIPEDWVEQSNDNREQGDDNCEWRQQYKRWH